MEAEPHPYYALQIGYRLLEFPPDGGLPHLPGRIRRWIVIRLIRASSLGLKLMTSGSSFNVLCTMRRS